jgi:hypothetical protein
MTDVRTKTFEGTPQQVAGWVRDLGPEWMTRPTKRGGRVVVTCGFGTPPSVTEPVAGETLARPYFQQSTASPAAEPRVWRGTRYRRHKVKLIVSGGVTTLAGVFAAGWQLFLAGRAAWAWIEANSHLVIGMLFMGTLVAAALGARHVRRSWHYGPGCD